MNKLIKIAVILIVILTIVQVIVSNSLSTTGVRLGKMQDEIARLKNQNQVLKEKLLSESSLTALSVEATKLGYIPSKSQVVISQTLPIALKQ